MSDNLPAGLYDLISTSSLKDKEENSGLDFMYEKLSVDLSHERLSDELAKQLSQLLSEFKGDTSEKLKNQIAFINQLLSYSREQVNGKYQIDQYSNPPQILRAINPDKKAAELPNIGLSQPWLFTAGKGSPSLLNELRAELASCQKVDILVSFIMVSGIRKIIDILRNITSTDASGNYQTKIRIITTTYTGATQQKALDQLAELPGCEVRISHSGKRTKLHAKAWIFERDTDFGSAYVGSANLSHSAMINGLEWTVKFTENGQKSLYSRAQAHFETLWLDNEFQTYDPKNVEHVERLKESLKRESGSNSYSFSRFIDVDARPHQIEILEQLEDERSQGRMKNLLVAATGTGKTIMAALDYRRIAQEQGGQPRLLFVAHRKEILQQSIHAYRNVMRDNDFGELFYGGQAPDRHEHLFATIQSVQSRGLLESLGADYWQVVVIDECHHIEAATFKKFVEVIKPKYLLGLTATPERADGKSILQHFDNRPDGTPAAQLRLWQALDDQLLAPFEYYACDDGIDYSHIPWKRAGETAALDNLLTGNDVRAKAIIRAWDRLVANPKACKTLVFCVSVAHAEFMERKLKEFGIVAKKVTGQSSAEERANIPRQLEKGEFEAVVTVDLYNEGIDLPFVDTLLLLRPTQSISLFQQQIGRGLRHFQGKESCLVLDFVGQYRENFRFDLLYGSITGLSKKEVFEGVEKGFGKLPAGCHIQLEKQARENILSSIKQAVNQNWKKLQTELLAHISLKPDGQTTSSNFLYEQQLELTDIYKKKADKSKSGWTNLKRAAGIIQTEASSEEEYLSGRLVAIIHIDDRQFIAFLKELVNTIDLFQPKNEIERLQLLMFAYQVDIVPKEVVTVEKILNLLRENREIVKELGELCDFLDARTQHTYQPLPEMDHTPLKLHASYEQREILAAISYMNSVKRPSFREGVLRDKERKIELLFVTIDKSDAVHEGVAYHDYAISNKRFHWQSQNSASATTETGKRYIESHQNGWGFQLFVRQNKDAPYRACGPVRVVEYHGAKPMNIIWELVIPLPVKLFEQFNVL